MASQLFVQFGRHFSTTSVANGKLVTAPLAVFGTDGRYASALYSAAHKEKQLDVIEKELQGLQSLLKNDKKFSDFILNPVLQKQTKKEGLRSVLKKQNISKLTTNFCDVLVENGRLNKMSSIILTYMRIMSAHRGEVECEIVSAKPLDDATKTELNSALQGFLKKGESIKISTKVDPSLIGGLVVSIGDRYVDMSLASKVKLYSNLLSAPV